MLFRSQLLAFIELTCQERIGAIMTSSRIHVHNVDTGRLVRRIHHGAANLTSLAWTSSTGVVVIDTDTDTVSVIDILTSATLATYTSVQCMTSFRHNTQGAVLLFKNGMVQLIGGHDGRVTKTYGTWPDLGGASSIMVSRNGNALMASYPADASLRFVELP